MTRVIGMLEGNEDEHDALLHGSLAALLMGRQREPLVEHWLARGPGFAVACAAHERRWLACHPRKGAALDLGVRWLAVRTEAQTNIALDPPTWETLASAFKKVKKADRAQEQSAVRSAREGAPLALALWIDGAALLAEEAAADVAQIEARPEAEWNASANWLVALLPALVSAPSDATRAAALTVIERLDLGLVNRFAGQAKSVVALVGVQAARPLVDLLVAAHRSSIVEAPRARMIAEALATLEAPIVHDFFTRNVESRLVGTVAAAYLVAGKSGVADPAPRAVEVHEVATAASKVRSRRAKQTAKKGVAKRRRVEAVSQAPEASADELPWVLREPPWRNEHATPALPLLALPPRAPFEEKLHLRESDREGIDATTVIDDDDPVGLLAQQGLQALPVLLAQPPARAIQALRLVESARVGAWMIDELAGPRRAVVRTYFADRPEAVAAALLPRLLGDAPQKRRLLDAVNLLLGLGHAAVLRAEAASYGADASAALTRILEAARLVDCPIDPSRAPEWADPAKLPPVLLASGARLPAEATEHLVQMLALADGERAYPGIADVRAAFDPVAIDQFLVSLLEAWNRAKRWSELWGPRAAAALGGADVMRVLVKLAKEWVRERSTRERAQRVVEALGGGGLSAAGALVDLTRASARGLAEIAEEGLRSIARREQLTTEDLADVSVPSLDLDENGRALLDFGTRTFELTLGDDLAPRIADGEGHVVKTVRALKSDDPAKAQIGLERLRSLKKSLGEVARRSAFRFEQAMVLGRPWRADFFREAIVRHPLLGRIARRLVWARFDPRAAKDTVLVRVAEDGTFAGQDDRELVVAPPYQLRLVHPLELGVEETRAWGDVLADYAIIQPFPQIGRRVFAPTEEESAGTQLTRFRGLPALQMALQGRLVARGWERLTDGGSTHGYVRRLKTVTAQYSLAAPIVFGEPFVNETTVGTVSFSLPVSRVPPILFSEVAYDLHVFAEPS
ncbi:MAG TPA: DUF4132 domain-containing protein [Labilithrix sp.]|nr:DUF4132 domain-containing protein [Labilithrix sp.]